MIIFYNKETGKIEGTIAGRVHREDHLKMWVGNKDETKRIVCNWKKDKKEKKWKPDVKDKKQAKIFESLDKKKTKIKEYEVDVKSKTLRRKQKN